MSTAQEYRHLIDECLNWASVCEREPYRTMLFEIAKEWHREAIRLGRPASAQGYTTEHRPFERRVGEKSGGVFERPPHWSSGAAEASHLECRFSRTISVSI